jgi:hypothetical protein
MGSGALASSPRCHWPGGCPWCRRNAAAKRSARRSRSGWRSGRGSARRPAGSHGRGSSASLLGTGPLAAGRFIAARPDRVWLFGRGPAGGRCRCIAWLRAHPDWMPGEQVAWQQAAAALIIAVLPEDPRQPAGRAGRLAGLLLAAFARSRRAAAFSRRRAPAPPAMPAGPRPAVRAEAFGTRSAGRGEAEDGRLARQSAGDRGATARRGADGQAAA